MNSEMSDVWGYTELSICEFMVIRGSIMTIGAKLRLTGVSDVQFKQWNPLRKLESVGYL